MMHTLSPKLAGYETDYTHSHSADGGDPVLHYDSAIFETDVLARLVFAVSMRCMSVLE